MKLRHDNLGRRNAFARVHVDRNAAPVVADGNTGIGMDLDAYEVGMTGQRLIDAVIHDLIDHVMQARAVIRVPDIHAGTLAHGFQALENLDGIGAIFGGLGGGFGHCHSILPWAPIL
ncbi:hypothetical protein D3C76_1459650 [compost metagenome]